MSKIKYTEGYFYLEMELIMRYILPAGTFTKLGFLREEYQKDRKVNLDKDPSFFSMPTWAGGINISKRRQQALFIEKMIYVLSDNLLKQEDIINEPQRDAVLTASRVMIIACLFVQSEISKPQSNSKMYTLINAKLGITNENYLDADDLNICFKAANCIINSPSAEYDANMKLSKSSTFSQFGEPEWRRFSDYIKTNLEYYKTSEDPYQHYPITSITKPLFGTLFGAAGAAVGLIAGEVLSGTTQAISPKLQMTAAIGSTLLMLGSTGPVGIALFSQVLASKFITYYCCISLSRLCELSMNIVGQGVGIGIGAPLDLAYILLKSSCNIIHEYYTRANYPKMTGILIGNGLVMIEGIPPEIKITEAQYIEAENPGSSEIEANPQLLEAQNGNLYVDGNLITISTNTGTLPPEVIEKISQELNRETERFISQLEPRTMEQNEEDIPELSPDRLTESEGEHEESSLLLGVTH